MEDFPIPSEKVLKALLSLSADKQQEWEALAREAQCLRRQLKQANETEGLFLAAYAQDKNIPPLPDPHKTTSSGGGGGGSGGGGTLKKQLSLKSLSGKIMAVDWAQDNYRVLSASHDGKLVVWNALAEIREHLMILDNSFLQTCSFSPSSKLVATGGLDNHIHVFSLPEIDDEKQPAKISTITRHQGPVYQIQFISENKILSASGDGTIQIFDVTRNGGGGGAGAGAGGAGAGGSSNFGSLLGGGLGGVGQQSESTFTSHTKDVLCCHYKAGTFITGSVDKTVKFWDPRVHGDRSVFTFHGHTNSVNCVRWLPTNNYTFATGSDDGTSRLFDLRMLGQLNMYATDEEKDSNAAAAVTSIDFSSTGRLLFAGNSYYTVVVWDTVTGDPYAELSDKESTGEITCVRTSPDGRALAVGSRDQTISIWA